MEYNIQAITVAARDTGERDVLATLFTLERGRAPVLVRGTKKTVSTLRPATILLNEGQGLVAQRRNTDLLTEWLPGRSFSLERATIPGFLLAAYCARMAAELTSSLQPEPRMFHLLKNTLLLLQNVRHYGIIKMIFEWGLLEISGQAFDLDVCVDCGNRLSRHAKTYLAVPEGGIVCPGCFNNTNKDSGLFFGLETLKFGKNIREIYFSMSGDSFTEKERASAFEKTVRQLSEKMNCKTTQARFQKGLTRFIQYHINEWAPAWLIRV